MYIYIFFGTNNNTVITRDDGTQRRSGGETSKGSKKTRSLSCCIRQGETRKVHVNEAISILKRYIPACTPLSRSTHEREHNGTRKNIWKWKKKRNKEDTVCSRATRHTIHSLTTTGFESRLSRIAYCSLDRASLRPPPLPLPTTIPPTHSIDDRSADLPRHTMLPRESLPLRRSVGTS